MPTLRDLPAVERYPRATVARADERTLISFAGDAGTREVEIDLRHVGDVDDVEQTELQLLASLQAIGYEVEWHRAPGDDASADAPDLDDAGPGDGDPDDPGGDPA